MADRSMSTMFDDDLDDDFLAGWKPPNSVTHDKGLKVHEVQQTKPKRKAFTSPKLDIDFDFEASFEIPSFDIDLAGLDFSTEPSKTKTLIDKSLEDYDDFSVKLKGSDNLNPEHSRKSKVDTPAPSARSRNNSVTDPVPRFPGIKITDVQIPESNLRQRKLGDIEGLDVSEESSSGKKDPILTETSKENSECIAKTTFSSSRKLPGFETQVELEPVNNNERRNLSQHFRPVNGEQSTGSLHRLIPDKPGEKSRSGTQSVSSPAEDHLKRSEVEDIAQAVLRSKTPGDKHTEVPHVSKFKIPKKSFPLDGEEAINTQLDAIMDINRKEFSSAAAKERQTLVSKGMGDRKDCSTPRLQDEESTKVENKLVVNTLVEDCIVLPECLEHRGEETTADRPDSLPPPVNEEKQSVHEEPATVADPLESRPAFVFPVVHLGKETQQTSTQDSSIEAATKDHQREKDHITKKYTPDGSVPRRETSRSPITSTLNLRSGNSLMKEQKVLQELDTGVTRHSALKPLGSTQIPTFSEEIHALKEIEQQADGECTNNGKRKFANEHVKKDKRQVRFQIMEKAMPKLQNQTVADDEAKQSQVKEPNFPSAGFDAPPSFRLAMTTTANAEQSTNRSSENRFLRTGRLRTGLLAQSKRVHRGSSDVAQKKHGLAEFAKKENVNKNRIINESRFRFDHSQITPSTPKGNPTKYAPLPFSKTRAEPEAIDAGASKKIQRNPTTRAPLKGSPNRSGEPECLKAGAREAEENQETRDGKESMKKFVSADTSAVHSQSLLEVLLRERGNIMEQANRYSDRLDDMVKNLNKLNGDAKDLVVRALICNNKLLMMQSPRYEERISSLRI